MRRRQLKCIFNFPHIRILLVEFKVKIKKVFGRVLSSKVTHNFLKSEHEYSNKRFKIPLWSIYPILKYLQSIFSRRILQLISVIKRNNKHRWVKLLRSIKANYSLIPKGKIKSFINSIFEMNLQYIKFRLRFLDLLQQNQLTFANFSW